MVQKPDNIFLEELSNQRNLDEVRPISAMWQMPAAARPPGGGAYSLSNLRSPARLMPVLSKADIYDLTIYNNYPEIHYMYLQPVYTLQTFAGSIVIPTQTEWGGAFDGTFSPFTCPWCLHRPNSVSSNYSYDFLLPYGTEMTHADWVKVGEPIRFLVIRLRAQNKLMFLPSDEVFYGDFWSANAIMNTQPNAGTPQEAAPYTLVPLLYYDNGTNIPFIYALSDYDLVLDGTNYTTHILSGKVNGPTLASGVVGLMPIWTSVVSQADYFTRITNFCVPFTGWSARVKKRSGAIVGDYVTTNLP